MNIGFHKLAGLFPLMGGAEFESLATDIRKNGLIEPVILHESKILDGRNRYLACQKARIEPRFTDFNGGNPLDFVLSVNLERRHLTSDQRAACAVTMLKIEREKAKERQGTRTDLNIGEKIPQGKATNILAAKFKTNRKYIESLERLLVGK